MIAALAVLSLPSQMKAQGESDSMEVHYLIVNHSGGAVSKFALSEGPELSFATDSVIVSHNGNTLTFSLFDIVDYTFSSEKISTGIRQVEVASEETVRPSLRQGKALFEGLHPKDKVRVYGIGGMMINSVEADDSGRAEVNLGSLGKGIYILRTPECGFKITNK